MDTEGHEHKGGRTKSYGGDYFYFDRAGVVCQVSERVAKVCESKFPKSFERISFDDAMEQWKKDSKKGLAGAVPVEPGSPDTTKSTGDARSTAAPAKPTSGDAGSASSDDDPTSDDDD